MRIGSAFPSKYLKASDIPDGQFVPLTMDHVGCENVAGSDDPEDQKPVLYFKGKQKGMVLNKTNATTITGAYGDETEDWQGKPVLLYQTETSFQGKTMPCLRIKIPKATTPTAQANGGGRVTQELRQRQTVPAGPEGLAESGEVDPNSIPF